MDFGREREWSPHEQVDSTTDSNPLPTRPKQAAKPRGKEHRARPWWLIEGVVNSMPEKKKGSAMRAGEESIPRSSSKPFQQGTPLIPRIREKNRNNTSKKDNKSTTYNTHTSTHMHRHPNTQWTLT